MKPIPCKRCGTATRIQVQCTLSAPSELYSNFTKANLQRTDVSLISVNWETTDFICQNPKCMTATDGYGNYVSRLAKENEELKAKLATYEDKK